jgi:acyl-coenzyme A thioesterase PaaI-like protein
VTALAYPPAHHVIRDLQITTDRMALDHSLSICPLNDHVRNASGAAGLGLLVAVTDVSGATVALAAASPDWPATADLAYQAIGPITEGPVLSEAWLVRRGSKTVVIEVEVFDGLGAEDTKTARPAGTGVMTFGRLPGSASGITIDPTKNMGRSTVPRLDSGLSAPLLDEIGLRVIDAKAGLVEVAKSDYIRNSFGTINGRVMGMVMQGAAEAAGAAFGPFVATDIQLHYLAQTKSGPLRASTRVLRATSDHAVCRVRAVDAGNDDLVVALATVTLEPW